MKIPNNRGRRSRKVAQETKLQILRTAMELFCEHGYQNVSVRMISSVAGGTHTLVLHHFGGKENIWLQISDHMVEYVISYNKALRSTLDSNKADNVNLYQFCAKSYAQMLLDPKPLIFLLDGIRHNPSFYNHFYSTKGAISEELAELVKAYNDSGKGKAQCLDKLAWKLLASAHSSVYLKLFSKEDSTIGLTYSQCLLEQWQVINDHLVHELSVPEQEKLIPVSLEELMLHQKNNAFLYTQLS